ncbi:hypothetical protein ACSU1N_02640 [Thermogladius sp. 4427co]|uniref:hypothetical protein n=1 Tax=Thermogladius sp. 4427co TaxID=3450718 RepID=UPI003F7909E7
MNKVLLVPLVAVIVFTVMYLSEGWSILVILVGLVDVVLVLLSGVIYGRLEED